MIWISASFKEALLLEILQVGTEVETGDRTMGTDLDLVYVHNDLVHFGMERQNGLPRLVITDL